LPSHSQSQARLVRYALRLAAQPTLHFGPSRNRTTKRLVKLEG